MLRRLNRAHGGSFSTNLYVTDPWVGQISEVADIQVAEDNRRDGTHRTDPSRLEGMLARFLEPLSDEDAAENLSMIFDKDQAKHGWAIMHVMRCGRAVDLILRTLVGKIFD